MRSLADIQAAALAELGVNPSITVYRMVGGVEVNRRPANPLARLTNMLVESAGKFEELGIAADAANADVRAWFGSLLAGQR